MAPGSPATSGLVALGLWAARTLPLAFALPAIVVYAWVVVASTPDFDTEPSDPPAQAHICIGGDTQSEGVRNESLRQTRSDSPQRPVVFIVDSDEHADLWKERLETYNQVAEAKGQSAGDDRAAVVASSVQEAAVYHSIHLENQVRLDRDMLLLRVVDLRDQRGIPHD
jgi:hypothetical protein